jgi:hypothetical protein
MNTRVSPARCLKVNWLRTKYHLNNGAKLALNRCKPGLMLPSVKRLSIIFNDKLYVAFSPLNSFSGTL